MSDAPSRRCSRFETALHKIPTTPAGNPSGGNDVFNLDAQFDSLEASLGALNAAAHTGAISLVITAPGQVDVFVNHDQNGATPSLHVATIMSSDPINIGQDVVVA